MRSFIHFAVGPDLHACRGVCLAGVNGVRNPMAGRAAADSDRLGAGSGGGHLCNLEFRWPVAGRAQRRTSNVRVTVKRLRDSGPLYFPYLGPERQAAVCTDRPPGHRSGDVSNAKRSFAARRQPTPAPSRTSHLIDSARPRNPSTRLRSRFSEGLNFNKCSGSIQVAARRPFFQELKAL